MTLRCLRRLARRGPVSVWLAVTLAATGAAVLLSALVLWVLGTAVLPALLLSLLTPLLIAPPMAWAIARLACALEAAERRARALSMSDPVSGLPNSRFLHEIGAQQVYQARRYSHPLTAVLFRLDALDARPPAGVAGLPPGDPRLEAVLRSAASRLRILVRESDIFCRLDDDSFVLLLPETDGDGAALMVDRLRQGLASAPGADGRGLTARFGVAAMTRPELAHLLERARASLAEAVDPDSVVVAPAPTPVAPPRELVVD